MNESNRLLSLDVFRGITIAGMILVNNPGSWSTVYSPLLHADWHGCTPTDLVFPFFLFMVGVAIPLALGKRKERGDARRAIYLKIFRRTLLIFGIGLFLAAFPKFQFGALRIPGVLQRIALVYCACAVLFLQSDWKGLLKWSVGLLLGYWGLMTLVPVPGGYPPNLDAETNLGAWLDRTILTSDHLWRQSKTWDPEGLLSTLPAIVTGLTGVLTGLWIKTSRNNYEKLTGMFAVGAILVLVGLCWNLVFPINKKIWTSSYVLYAGGLALVSLGVVYWLVDVLGKKGWIKPFVVYGTNALFAFVLSGLFAKTMGLIRLPAAEGETQSMGQWLYQNLFLSWLPDYPASLGYALFNVLLILGITWILYSRRIFIKV